MKKLKKSKVYTDDRGDYIVVDRDTEGNEFKVYITWLIE